jgi:hypothetical protein
MAHAPAALCLGRALSEQRDDLQLHLPPDLGPLYLAMAVARLATLQLQGDALRLQLDPRSIRPARKPAGNSTISLILRNLFSG